MHNKKDIEKALKAARHGNLKGLESLDVGPIENGSKKDVARYSDGLGASIVHHAARSGNIDVLIHLVFDCNFPGNSTSRVGATPAHDAAATGHLNALIWLLENADCKVDDTDNAGATVAHLAARYGHLTILKWLVTHDSDSIHEKTNTGALPLHFAAARGDLDTVKFLVEQQPGSVNAQLSNGATTAYLAAQEGHLEVLKYLVEEGGASLQIHSHDGMSPIHAAAQMGHFSCVAWLACGRVNIDARDFDGATAVHFAAGRGYPNVVDWLLTKGGKILRDNLGGTALHDAAEHGQLECVRVLMKHGCDPGIQDNNGMTAADLAENCWHRDCAATLRRRLGKSGSSPALPKMMSQAARRNKQKGLTGMYRDRPSVQGVFNNNNGDIISPGTDSETSSNQNGIPDYVDIDNMSESSGASSNYVVHPILEAARQRRVLEEQNQEMMRSAETGEFVVGAVTAIMPPPMLTIPPPPSSPPPPVPSHEHDPSISSSGVSSLSSVSAGFPDYENVMLVSAAHHQAYHQHHHNHQQRATAMPRSPTHKPVLARYHPVLQTNYENSDAKAEPEPTPRRLKKRVVIVEEAETFPISPKSRSPPPTPPAELAPQIPDYEVPPPPFGEPPVPPTSQPHAQSQMPTQPLPPDQPLPPTQVSQSPVETPPLQPAPAAPPTPPPPPPPPPPPLPPSVSERVSVFSYIQKKSQDGGKIFPGIKNNSPRSQSPNVDLIAELKKAKGMSSLKKTKKTKRFDPETSSITSSGSTAEEEGKEARAWWKELGKNRGNKAADPTQKTERSETGRITLTEDFDPKKYLDEVPVKDASGHDLPPWKRLLIARQIAERKQKEFHEKKKVEEEESRFKNMPPWRRALIEKKEAELKATIPESEKEEIEEKPSPPIIDTKHKRRAPEPPPTDHLDEDGLPLAPWQQELRGRKPTQPNQNGENHD